MFKNLSIETLSKVKKKQKQRARICKMYNSIIRKKKDPKVAPAIQQQRDELEKRKIEDSLRHKIDHRPAVETLVEQNILKSKKFQILAHT